MAGNDYSPNNIDLRGFMQDNKETGEDAFPIVDLKLMEEQQNEPST